MRYRITVRKQLQENQLRAKALQEIWQSKGRLYAEISSGTLLWHGGTISKPAEIDDSRSLWCTRNPDKSQNYDSWAREDSMIVKRPPFRLMLTTTHQLILADFGCASLLNFTKTFCNYQHNDMKIVLRNWCLANGFNGVKSINGDLDEVVICKPKSHLRIVEATPL